MILTGLALAIMPFCNRNKYTENIIKVLLVIAGVIMLFLALVQLTHGIFTPQYRMGHGALGDMFIFYAIVLVAGNA